MKRFVPLLAVLIACGGCGPAPPEPRVTVDGAIVILPVLPDRPGAAYFTLRANKEPVRLTGVTSPRIGRIELHETVTRGSIASMRPLGDAAVSPGAPLPFAPGGRHAMLFDIDPSLRPGGTVPLSFSFEAAAPVTVQAEVRAAGDARDAS